MEFNFSIRQSIKKAWAIFKMHPWFFVGISFVMLVINALSNIDDNFILQIVTIVAAVIWSYVWLSIALAAVDGKNDELNFHSIKKHMPSFKNFIKLVIVGIATGIIVLVGFVLLIIPGVYFLIRLCFSNFSYVDRKGKVRDALKHSWHLVKGDIFWTVFLVLMVAIALILLGVVALAVGILVTYPLAMLLMAQLYRDLNKHHSALEQMVPQPAEIPPKQE